MVKYCPKCGNASYDSAPKCGNCGYDFTKSTNKKESVKQSSFKDQIMGSFKDLSDSKNGKKEEQFTLSLRNDVQLSRVSVPSHCDIAL